MTIYSSFMYTMWIADNIDFRRVIFFKVTLDRPVFVKIFLQMIYLSQTHLSILSWDWCTSYLILSWCTSNILLSRGTIIFLFWAWHFTRTASRHSVWQYWQSNNQIWDPETSWLNTWQLCEGPNCFQIVGLFPVLCILFNK